jgi:hypothetical protein
MLTIHHILPEFAAMNSKACCNTYKKVVQYNKA